MASHARAGETLLLKLLHAHPHIHVPLQIEQHENSFDANFVEEIRTGEMISVAQDHPYIARHRIQPASVIVIKQGTWAPSRFQGFVLLRQPYAFVSSMIEYNRREGLGFGITHRSLYKKTFVRLNRWSQAMNSDLNLLLQRQNNVINALSIFYRERVEWLISRNLPVFRYETLVLEPKNTLSQICSSIGLKFDERMLHAHKTYSDRPGHGMNDLERPIDKNSLNKWKVLSRRHRENIFEFCGAISRKAGYQLKIDEVLLL